MGLVKFGQGVAKISGKVGGTVFATNRFGAYARNFAVPINPNTTRQSTARARVSAMADRWNQVLTDVQRDAWRLYAVHIAVLNRLGDVTYLTGFNHYIRSNCAILAIDGTVVDDAPVLFTLPEADPTFDIEASEATQLVSVTFDPLLGWVGETGGYMSVQMGIPQLTNVNFFGGPWRSMDAIAGDTATPPTSPETMIPPWAVSENQRIWARARIIRADGRLSNFFRSSADVGA